MGSARKIQLALAAIVVGIYHGESSSSSNIACFSHGMIAMFWCRNVDIHASNECSLFPRWPAIQLIQTFLAPVVIGEKNQCHDYSLMGTSSNVWQEKSWTLSAMLMPPWSISFLVGSQFFDSKFKILVTK
jgi:hypothetical protein